MFALGWEERNKRAVEWDMRDLLGELDDLREELAKVKFQLKQTNMPRTKVEKKTLDN